ncbi:MAG TPA: DUF2231 domain-containing protein [Gemmatimonadales bacterium]|nr:DUF2231 domain-containing protein [Gemmatimonadales bacterium]
MHIFGYDWPKAHAALNDLPAALLLMTVLFDWAAWITKRESLRSAAIWTLWAGVIGGWCAVLSGLQAEDAIDHGPAIHKLMEDHQNHALVAMGFFTAVLLYKLFRRGILSRGEEIAMRVLSILGLIGVIWTARIGGDMYFEHAAGVPTAVFAPEAQDRALEHGHGAPGHDEHEHGEHDDHEHEEH